MNFLRVILLLLASVRLLQPSGVCGCQVAEVFQDLACLDIHADGHGACHCCPADQDSDHDEPSLAESSHPLGPVVPSGHLPGKNCVGLVSTTPISTGMEKVDWVGSPALVENLRPEGLGLAGADSIPGIESGPPFLDSFPRRFLLNRSILL